MSPGKTRKEVLKKLRQTRNAMMSAAWTSAIRKKPVEVRREAALTIVDINDAIHVFQNRELAEIRDKLIKNKTELLEGTAKLGKALESLNRVRRILDSAGAVLGAVAKVVKFVVTHV